MENLKQNQEEVKVLKGSEENELDLNQLQEIEGGEDCGINICNSNNSDQAY